MDIFEKKLSDEEVLENQIEGISHEWYGKPTELQSLFDRLCKFLIARYNSLIDLLSSNKGASNIKTTTGISVEESLAQKAEKSAVYSKEEADAVITDRIIHTGNGNMIDFIYDFDKDGVVEASDLSWNSNKLGGKPPSSYALAEQVRKEFSHSRVNGVHQLEGVGTHIFFIADDQFTQGEGFLVNGTAIDVVNYFNQPLGTGAFRSSDVVFGIVLADRIMLNTRRVPYRLWQGATFGNTISVPYLSNFDYISLSDEAVSLCRVTELASPQQMIITFYKQINDQLRTGIAKLRHSAKDEITIDNYGEVVHIITSGHSLDDSAKVQEIWGY